MGGRGGGLSGRGDVRATKFNRNKIETMLRLLKGSGHEAWSHITISEENLSQWPEEGDICDVVENVVVDEVDDEDVLVLGDIDDAAGGDSGVGNNIGSLVVRDGDDIGPAPLQNDVIPSETYEGSDVDENNRPRTCRRTAEEAADAAHAVAAAPSIRATASNNRILCVDESSMVSVVDIAWINMQLKNIEDATPQLRAETIMYLG
mmetsp:Transcript_8254/g.12485  ORF Transcript_8254/g.12485 Transcript_8254/m.12485 type:complete len:205 (-) Transcript_8254:614-1228(-)